MKCKLKMSFTNGVPESLGGQGFNTTIEGSYEKCLALIDEMRKAIVMFKEEDVKEAKP